MKPLTREWVRKAEADFATARREFRVRKGPNYDDVCFHAQQCVEKYLKARLQETNTPFPKTHQLEHLPDLLLPTEPTWATTRSDLQKLSSLAVSVRYPGYSADKRLAAQALSLCEAMRRRAREGLGLRD
jgi:HEPN domain-containing protein